jgi:two-component system, NarL family, nitrate/nitrite response regulator NarL
MNSPRPPISIVLADDHPVVLHGMAGILRAQPDINVVALCGDGIAAAEAIRRFVPDIAVLDIRMPGLNGLDVLSSITSDGLATKVIFLSAAATDDQILTAITRGAKGVMLKDIAPESLADPFGRLLAVDNGSRPMSSMLPWNAKWGVECRASSLCRH